MPSCRTSRALVSVLLCSLAWPAAAQDISAPPQPIAAGSVVLWATADGRVLATGDGESGRGDPGDEARRHFEPIAGLKDVIAVAVQHDDDNGSAALDRQGHVWVWGSTFCAFSGDWQACEAKPEVPRRVPGFENIAAIAAGGDHLIALDRAGRVFAVGDNEYGQLGTGNDESRAEPAAVSGVTDAIAIAASPHASYLVRRDGTVWGMGLGWGGMLGPNAKSGGLFDGLDEKSANLKPLLIKGPKDIVAISAGNRFVVARDRTGQVWGWGSNESAELGYPAIDLAVIAPRPLRGFSNVVDVAAGYDFVLAATRDGKILAQGGNVYGALGDQRGELDGKQRTIAGIDDAQRVFAGHYNAFAQRRDGGFIGWGSNHGSVGGFAPRLEEANVPPTALDADARPAPPSAIVQAGGVSLPIGLELGSDQRSERVVIEIAGRPPVTLVVNADIAEALARVELPVGAHPYSISGEAVMEDGNQLPIEGNGVLVVTREGLQAQFESTARAGGLAAGLELIRASVGEPFTKKTDAATRIQASGSMSDTSLQAAQAKLAFRMPAAYSNALRELGPFELRLGTSPFAAVALYAPERLQTMSAWLTFARANIQDPPRDVTENDLSTNLSYRDEELKARTKEDWTQDLIGAVFPESSLYLIVPKLACDDGSAREREADVFSPEVDEDTGEERYFAWADYAGCDAKLVDRLRTAAGENLIHHYRLMGAVFLSNADKDRVWTSLQRDSTSTDQVLRLRLSN